MTTDRITGVSGFLGIKAPCKAAATSNITLSGEQTIDGVACITGDRVLVTGQIIEADNGIYVVSTGGWTRAKDWNGINDIVQGTYVKVSQGSVNEGLWYVNTNNPIIIGTTSVTFTKELSFSAPNLGDLLGDSDDIDEGATNLFLTTAERSKLSGIAAGAEVNVNADWNAVSGDAQILNKPTLGTIAAQDADDVTIAGGNATLTGGTFDDVLTTDLQATTSAGLNFKTNSGVTAFSYGGGGSTTLVLSGGLSLGGTTFTDSTGADTKLASGTAGTNGNVAMWNSDGDVVDGNVVAANILVDSDIGVAIQAYDADILKADTTDTLTVGYSTTPNNLGTITSGTVTPDEADGQQQYYVNGGAHTLAPPTNNTCITLQVTNNASAGAITTSSFTIVTGDTLTTTDGDDFFLRIEKLNGFSQLHITALQ